MENKNNKDNIIEPDNSLQKNEIKNEILDMDSIDHKPNNDNENQIIEKNPINPKPKNEFKKDPNKKYKIKFSVLIEELRQNSDQEEKMNMIEFTGNLLLMSSQINQTNKISCLTVLSYINHQKENAIYTYYLNKKIFKYLQVQKSIESFIYIRTLFRAAYFLSLENNFFYSRKYIVDAENLSKNSKIDANSSKMLEDAKNEANKGIINYIEVYTKKFKDIEKEDNLTEDKYIQMKKLFNDLNKNKYALDFGFNNNNKLDNNEYLYLINKNWFIKANKFFADYINIRDNSKRVNYFKEAFNVNTCYQAYFLSLEDFQKIDLQFTPFPCLIDNYSIINWTDIWHDPLNEDENYVLQNNLKEGKDFLLLEKKDFDLLQQFFGVSNVIKRKKTDFIEFKAIILDKRLRRKENIATLRKRHIQVRNNYKISDLKEKIIRCINYAFENNKKEYENLMEMKKIKDLKKEQKGIYINKKNEEEKIQDEEDNDDKISNNNYTIHFYLLEKQKKDILMEICVSLVNRLPKYKTIFLQKIFISEEDPITNLISKYNKNTHILIIELQNSNDSLFINPLIPNSNNAYKCSLCEKEIQNINSAYKCNICNYSLFCSDICSESDKDHEQLDKIYLTNYLYEEFNLESFLKKDITDLPMLTPQSPKGMVGLINLGNTCYINSTVQCLSNTFDLTKYFLLQYFRNDINTGNKLGSNGNLALKYYNLLCDMWFGVGNKIDPKPFVTEFKKWKKQFEGYRQQDAQEFLSALLDQLHEDLNRITDKPYIELLEKQANEDDLAASKRWWDLHKKREDSIIVDLFNGQFKSETICSECKKSSITYDPFMSLCVPLPKTKTFYKFKIFIEYECKYLDFIYEDKSTILDLKQKAKEFISKEKKNVPNNYDLEMVLLDENKAISKIISTDVNDKKNYMGGTLLKKILINKSEIIIFEKRIFADEDNYINIFVYPIEHQIPNKDYLYWNHSIPLKYLSYPLFFQVKQDTIVNQFYNDVMNRIRYLHFYREKEFQKCLDNNQMKKIIELNIIHSKETKKDGFFAWIMLDDSCKYCNQSNIANYYCSISNLGKYDKTIGENFKKVKKPIILAATSDCYDLTGNGRIYLESDLFISDNKNSENSIGQYTESVILSDCLELFISNENFQDNSWFCSNCKKLQNSIQKLQIYKPPNYLIILIKRYNINKEFGERITGEKNNTFISYPVNNFDISEYIVGPEKEKAKYDLYGVIEHYGTLNQGHYTAICKNDGNWVSYNDSICSIVKSPVTKNAYVLFYKMKNIGDWINDKNKVKEDK